jgi:HlyD family secretion protein
MGMDRQIEKRTWTPKKIALLAAAVLFVAFAVYVFVFKFRTSTLSVEIDRTQISTVTKGPFQEFIAVMGSVIPRNTYFLDALEGGTVEKIYIEAGTMVKAGDSILKLSNTNTVLDIMWRESDLFNASNNLRQTRLQMEQYKMQIRMQMNDVENLLQQEKRKYDRYAELVKTDLISQHEFEIQKDQYEYLVRKREITVDTQKNDLEFRELQLRSLDESVRRLQESLQMAKRKLENLVVRAPVTGYLTALDAQIGESKTPGKRLGQIDILEGFKVRAQIDENYLPRIEIGRTGVFELAGQQYGLTVRKVYPEVKDNRFEVDLEFAAAEPKGVTRGQTLHIDLNLSDLTEAMLLAKGGFYAATGGNWVYVVDPAGKFADKRTIKLGRQNTREYEVLEGLQPGDKVVTSSYESFGGIDRLVFKK